MQAEVLKECKSKKDRLEACIKKTYYANGNIKSETSYKNGELYGIAKIYFKNGKLKSETHYRGDEIHGVVKHYFSNGKLKAETPYIHDTIHGSENYYYKNGKHLLSIIYQDGVAISGVCNKQKLLTTTQIRNWHTILNIADICNQD